MAHAEVREDLEAFRARARAWIADHLEPLGEADPFMGHATDEADQVVRAKAHPAQACATAASPACATRRSTAGGACRPRTRRRSTRSPPATRCPQLFNIPTLTIIAPTILDFGTEEQKQALHPRRAQGRRAVGAVPLRADAEAPTWPAR